MITTSDYFISLAERATRLGGYTLPAVFEAVVTANGNRPAVFDGVR
ncbi:MAG: hypothetical protein JOZ18_01960, partial [Chloroflexi bacterium]|nr:hypothetical protein [Chloroflexota bacterium]